MIYLVLPNSAKKVALKVAYVVCCCSTRGWRWPTGMILGVGRHPKVTSLVNFQEPLFFIFHMRPMGKYAPGVNQGIAWFAAFWSVVAETLTAGLTGALAFSDLSALSAKVALWFHQRIPEGQRGCLTIEHSIPGTWWVWASHQCRIHISNSLVFQPTQI